MDVKTVKVIEELSIKDASEIKRDELCNDCGLWPCYATAPECLRYEED